MALMVAEPIGQGYNWPRERGGSDYHMDFGHGAAGIGRSFLEVYLVGENRKHLHRVEGAAKWLMSIAISERGGHWWLLIDGKQGDPQKRYVTAMAGVRLASETSSGK